MRRLPTVLLLLAAVLCLMRFCWLRADFPNHSPWWRDQAKFTDEGWWASGAVRHQLTGHWHVAGDYNPAIVVPVWPLMLATVFRVTGVSLPAARAVSVLCSLATVMLLYLLARRYSDALTAAAAALLLAASPFAFAFARLATLDTIIVGEFCLMLWTASFVDHKRRWPAITLGLLLPLTLLTKTTALVLLPAILWLMWTGAKWQIWRPLLWTGPIAALLFSSYLYVVLHSSYAADYRYFFDINALAEIDPGLTGTYLHQLLQNGLWVDHVLYPLALAMLALSMTLLRVLWKNPLWVACWLAIAGQAVFILRRQDDYAPRYFLPMLVPMILIAVLPLRSLRPHWQPIGWFLITLAALLDAGQTIRLLRGRQFQYWTAARSIRAIVLAHPEAPRLVLGTSADQLSLMTGLPAINDGYSLDDLQARLAVGSAGLPRPGWYLGWNDLDQDILAQMSAYRLDKVATYRVFDHDERDWLTLYRMQPAR